MLPFAPLAVRYFPHSVADFSLLLELVTSSGFHSYPWEARYILLLWLSLVVNIPFSLDKFGEDIYNSLEKQVLKSWLGSTGKERDAVALFGSKYFNRKDINEERLLAFLQWCGNALVDSADEAFLVSTLISHAIPSLYRQHVYTVFECTAYWNFSIPQCSPSRLDSSGPHTKDSRCLI